VIRIPPDGQMEHGTRPVTDNSITIFQERSQDTRDVDAHNHTSYKIDTNGYIRSALALLLTTPLVFAPQATNNCSSSLANAAAMASHSQLKTSVTFLSCAVLVFLASLSCSLPVDSTSSDQAVIVNGTQVAIAAMADVFVYCRAHVSTTDDLHHYRLEWHDSQAPIPSWNSNVGVFSLGSGTHVPHSYLVFHNFIGANNAGTYTCKLFQGNDLVSSSAVTVSGSSVS